MQLRQGEPLKLNLAILEALLDFRERNEKGVSVCYQLTALFVMTQISINRLVSVSHAVKIAIMFQNQINEVNKHKAHFY